VFFSVDVEASGTIPGFFDLLSIGAVSVARKDGEYEVGRHEFYVELKPVHGTVNPASMEVNGLDLRRLAEEGLSLEDAARRFAAFVRSVCPRRDPPVFVGYCAHFDWGYINDLFERAKIVNPFGYKVIDIRSMAYGVFQYDWNRIGQTRLLQLLEMQPLAPGEAHHALADARHQAEMLARLLKKRGEFHRDR
jgi:ribonuclease T